MSRHHEKLVTGRMPQRVVDVLEIVQVHEEDRDLEPLPVRSFQCVLDAVREQCSVREAGQGVGRGLHPETLVVVGHDDEKDDRKDEEPGSQKRNARVGLGSLIRARKRAKLPMGRGRAGRRGTGVGPGSQGDQGETGTAAAAGGAARSWVARRAEAPRWSRMQRMTRPSVMNATVGARWELPDVLTRSVQRFGLAS